MKSRMRRIRREFLCIGMAFLLMMLIPSTGLKSISIPVVQAQGGDPVFSYADLQFDGSRYYYSGGMYFGSLSANWRMYLFDNVNYVVSDIENFNFNIDTSEFYVPPGTCVGFQDCAQNCNTCVLAYRTRCKIIYAATLTTAGVAFGLSLKCAVAAAATVVGLGIAFGCGVVGGLVLVAAYLGAKAQRDNCNVDAIDACNAANPGCTCTG